MTLTIEAATELLKRAGFELVGSRFPFTYHHDFCRMGTGESRAEVAQRLTTSVLERHGEQAYLAVAMLGAIWELCKEQPLQFVRACKSQEFVEFVRALDEKVSTIPVADRTYQVQ